MINDPRAPWNEEEKPEMEIEVIINATFSKKVTLKVTDYECDEGIDGGDYYCDVDFDTCDLYAAAAEQVDFNTNDWDLEEFTVEKV